MGQSHSIQLSHRFRHVDQLRIVMLRHRASNFNFFRVRFCVDGRGAAAGLGLVEDRHDFETESTTIKMQVGKKGKELKGRNCEKVPSPARCALRTSSTVGTT